MATDGHGEVVIASGLINDGMIGWTLAKQTPESNNGWNGWPQMAAEEGKTTNQHVVYHLDSLNNHCSFDK